MGVFISQAMGCHPVLELKEAANKFAMTEMLQRRQFSVQERDREILKVMKDHR